MNETGGSEKEAREYVRHLVDELWKKLNDEYDDEKRVSTQAIIGGMSKNLARISQYMYQYGDGRFIDHNKTKESIVSLLVHPISTR